MGNAIVIAVTQLIAFPLFSRYFNKVIFGSITSVYGINTVIIVLTGDALANVRIIRNNKSGVNFNLLSIFDSFLLSLIISLVMFFIYGQYLSIFDKLIFSVTTSIMSVLEYGVSLYRVRLRYNLYLIQNIIVSIGYILGMLIFFKYHYWSIIFFTGNILALLFFIFNSHILRESFRINIELRNVIKSLLNISIGHVLSSIMSNLDRFLIPIVLGVTYLSPFFASNTLAKMFGLIMGPLSSVLLSHLSKSKIRWTRSKLNHITFYLLILGFVLIVPSYYISDGFIRILYPDVFGGYKHIQMIMLISCVATCFFEVWNILNTAYLTCLKSKFQIIINATFLILYLICATGLSVKFNLIGYSIGYMLSIIFSICISIILSNMNFFWKCDENNK